MPIKDKNYWKEYNQKRKEKGYFQSNYLQRKKEVVKNGEGVVKSSQVVKLEGEVVKSEVVKTNSVVKSEAVVKNESLQPTPILQPKEAVVKTENILQPNLQPTEEVVNNILQPKESLQPPKCPRCPELEKQLEAVATLPAAYIDERETKLKEKYQKEVDKLQTRIKELENPINPTIELWKKRYFDLEKKTDEKWKELDQTINRLKEKLREKNKQNKEWEQKYSNLQNSNQNISKSPIKDISKTENIIPVLLDREKKKIIFYSCPDPCYQGKFCSNCSASNPLSN